MLSKGFPWIFSWNFLLHLLVFIIGLLFLPDVIRLQNCDDLQQFLHPLPKNTSKMFLEYYFLMQILAKEICEIFQLIFFFFLSFIEWLFTWKTFKIYSKFMRKLHWDWGKLFCWLWIEDWIKEKWKFFEKIFELMNFNELKILLTDCDFYLFFNHSKLFFWFKQNLLLHFSPPISFALEKCPFSRLQNSITEDCDISTAQ